MYKRQDIGRREIKLKGKADEEEYAIPIMHMAVISREEDEEIMRSIDEKVGSIDCGDENVLTRLKEILVRNRSLFRELSLIHILYA